MVGSVEYPPLPSNEVLCMKRFLKSPYSWLAPPSLIVLFVITIVPTLFLFFTSLHHWELGYPWDARRFIGVQNFLYVVKNPLFFGGA